MKVIDSFRKVFSWSRLGTVTFFSLFTLMFLAYSGTHSDLERTQEELSQIEDDLEDARSGALNVVETEIIAPNPVVTRMDAEADGDVNNYHVKLVNTGDSGTIGLDYSFLSANRTVLATQNQTVGMSAGEEKTVDLRYSSPDDSETWEVSTTDVDSEEFQAKIFNTDSNRDQVNVTLTFKDSDRNTLTDYQKTETIPAGEYETVSFYVDAPEDYGSYNIHAGYAE